MYFSIDELHKKSHLNWSQKVDLRYLLFGHPVCGRSQNQGVVARPARRFLISYIVDEALWTRKLLDLQKNLKIRVLTARIEAYSNLIV